MKTATDNESLRSGSTVQRWLAGNNLPHPTMFKCIIEEFMKLCQHVSDHKEKHGEQTYTEEK